MASLELAILVSISAKSFEGGTAVALLMLLQMGARMVSDETLEQVELEVVLLVELLASLSLRISVVIVLVALVGECRHELLFALKAQFHKDTFLKIHLHSLNGILDLHKSLWLKGPGCCGGLESVEGLRFLLNEKF